MMIGVSTSPYNVSMSRKFNVWYSVKSGNWFDPTTWISNGQRHGHTYPQIGDDVYLNHAVTWDFADGPGLFLPSARTRVNGNAVKNLFIGYSGCFITNGSLGNQVSFFADGNVQCDGIIDWSLGQSGGGQLLNIGGNVNWINTFVPGNSTSNITVSYNSQTSFAIPSANYYHLSINTNSYNFLNTDLAINGILNVNSGQFELGIYNVTVGAISIGGKLTKSSSTGTFTVTNGSISQIVSTTGSVSFTGSPTINWSGDINTDTRTGVNFGTGTINILANCQMQLRTSGNIPTNIGAMNYVIASGKTLTVNGASAWLNNGSVTGASGTSTLNISTGYGYGNSNAVMSTGVFNPNFSGTSTIYIYAAITLPLTSYYNLQINSTGAIVGADTTVSNNFTTTAAFDFGTHNFSIGGASNFGDVITCTGSGTLSFKSISTNSKIDFSSGNPQVNISGNVSGDIRNGFKLGSTTVNLTANLTLAFWRDGNTEGNVIATFLIASGVTVTSIGISLGGTTGTGGINLTGNINGTDGTSSFVNKSSFIQTNSSAPMLTGVLDANTYTNLFTYGASGNQDVLAGTYKNLTLNGSGAKKLLGNVSVTTTYTLTSPATLNSNGFALTNP